ncbi:MAG: 50S ribosomal protein L31e [Candidatus Hodarchaeales archaeon]|jgi:large subunit ribosomal protein L31e
MSEIQDIDSEIIEQRTITVNFSKPIYGRRIPRTRRSPRAMRYLREFIARHLDVENVIIDPQVSHFIWERGIAHPPRRVTVKVTKTEDDTVEVFLAD